MEMWGKANKHQSKADGGEFSSDGRAGGATYTVAILRLLRPSPGGDWQNELTIVMGRPICPSDRIMYEHLSKPIAQFASESDCDLLDVTHSSPGLTRHT